MKTRAALLLLIAALAVGCKKNREPNKILDGLPVDPTVTVIPGHAAQQHLLLIRDIASVVVPVMNRVGLTGATFPELTPAGGGAYTFSVSNARYGFASLQIQFKDESDANVDPIQSATTTFKSGVVTSPAPGTSALFTHTTGSPTPLRITLETAGVGTSPKLITGDVTFSGSNYALVFSFAPAGAGLNFEGLVSGEATATGTGPDASAASLSLRFDSNRDADGTIVWEGRSGAIHLANNGIGFVSTDQVRFFID